MKKVVYIREDSTILDFTYGKVYDVIHYAPSVNGDAVYIKNDSGIGGFYYILDPYNKEVFKEFTAEFRSRIIDDILK